jgi:transcription initiation factor IIF auxiliary subunit
MRSQQRVSPRPCITFIPPSRTLSKVYLSPLPGKKAAYRTLLLAFHDAPFRCENEGWGEFDMTIDLYTTEKGGKNTLNHDLNFAKGRYEAKHVVTFKNPSAALINLLRESGPVPGDENGKKVPEKKRKRVAGAVDMEKLAEGLVKLGEDDLLHVVQMIHDNKSEDTYTKNDIERVLMQPQSSNDMLIMLQRASSMSTCILYRRHWSRCSGTLSQPMADHESNTQLI